MKPLVTVLALLTTPLLAYSGGVCRSRVVVSSHHFPAAVVATYAAPVQLAYAYPVYSASYNSAQAGIEEKLERIAAALEKLGVGGGGNQPATFEQLVTNKCASCHQDGKADTLGGGFVLSEKDGTIPPFSLAEQRRINQLVQEGKMPPKSPLSPSDKAAFTAKFAKKD